MGITSPLFPEELPTESQATLRDHATGGEPEVPQDKLDLVVFYLKTLGVPARRKPNDPRMCFMPIGRVASADIRSGLARPLRSFPAWPLVLLRFQVGVVYFFAGIAKLQPDWLLRGQPLRIWLVQSGLPLGDPYLAALACSWAGALIDLTAPFLLLHRRSRPWALGVLALFHLATAWLFPIGLFPWLMLVCLTLFLEPSWPRRVARTLRMKLRQPRMDPFSDYDGPVLQLLPATRAGRIAALGYMLLQLSVPLRHHLYEGDVLWNERGFRYSWRVMLTKKTAEATFTGRHPHMGSVVAVDPADYLTPAQVHFMKTQPDMIRQFAQMIRQDPRTGQTGSTEVYANVQASLNGRAGSQLIDPSANIAASTVSSSWILRRNGHRSAKKSHLPRRLVGLRAAATVAGEHDPL